MFVERRINRTNQIELWACEWESLPGSSPRKVFLRKIGLEGPVTPDGNNGMSEARAICWSYGRTLGNIAVFTPAILGSFPGDAGDDAQLPCDFVGAGKFRNGSDRWWCRTHQSHWGVNADVESYERSGMLACASHNQRMNYVVAPFEINPKEFEEVGIWCSMPAALSTHSIAPRPPRIHIHVRSEPGGTKENDEDYDAIAILYSDDEGLFGSDDITRVNVTPPAAFEFVRGLEEGRKMDCINCSSCGYPHLDLGDFAREPHRKHFCGNCGRDSTWSKVPIVSTPLISLHDQYPQATNFADPDRSLDLDEYDGCDYTIWASTPAIVWTAERPQERGIHVHVDNGEERVVDDTFSTVLLGGRQLSRADLLKQMAARTIT